MKRSGPRWQLLLVLLLLPWLLRWILSFTPAEGAGLGGAASVLAVALTLLLAIIWLLLLSRLPWMERLFGFLTVTLIGVVLAFCVRIEGHMGDFFPQLTWVWSPTSDHLYFGSGLAKDPMLFELSIDGLRDAVSVLRKPV